MKLSGLLPKPTPRVLQQFAAAWLVVFLALALGQVLAGHSPAGAVLAAVSLIGIIGLLQPAAVGWLFLGATVLAFPVGWVLSQLILAALFYLVLTPVALVFRWRGRDALKLRRRPGQASFWTERGEPPKAARYLKQF